MCHCELPTTHQSQPHHLVQKFQCQAPALHRPAGDEHRIVGDDLSARAAPLEGGGMGTTR